MAALQGAAVGAAVTAFAPIAVAAAGEVLMGAGVASGSASLFGAGSTVAGAGAALGAAVYGASAAASSVGPQLSTNTTINTRVSTGTVSSGGTVNGTTLLGMGNRVSATTSVSVKGNLGGSISGTKFDMLKDSTVDDNLSVQGRIAINMRISSPSISLRLAYNCVLECDSLEITHSNVNNVQVPYNK